ncbi:MAG: hypothetical protein ABMA13_18200 [Chthoniobacteraceae bacterium]
MSPDTLSPGACALSPAASPVQTFFDTYVSAMSRDWRVQLPALIALRKSHIVRASAALEVCTEPRRRRKLQAKLYHHRRMLRSYEHELVIRLGRVAA